MVNLIPRPIKKISKNQKILLYFLIFLVISLTTAYVFLISLEKQAQASLEVVEQQIFEQKTTEMGSLESTIQAYKKEVDDFTPYLNNHILITKFFDFLEENTHPNIYFSQMGLKSLSANVSLSGKADSFLTLGQQLMIFNNSPLVKSVSLSNISLSEEGSIIFSIGLSLDPILFKY